MSLVGSLEDLDLGDILQIIHLSRKSGALRLQTDVGEGQILFREGLIATAFSKGGPTDLRELLVAREIADESDLEPAAEYARARGHSLEETLLERSVIDAEALELARRAHAEDVVLRMFSWRSGEFSFEVRLVQPAEGGELFIEPGLNPQFLALEGTRQFDESEHDIVFDGEPESIEPAGSMDPIAPVDPVDPVDPATPAGMAEAEIVDCEFVDPLGGVDLDSLDAEPALSVEPALPVESIEPVEATVPAELLGEAPVEDEPMALPPTAGPPPPLVVIDSSLPVLEWVKTSLEAADTRIHVFQTSELGISRIRQYLARREIPLVLIAADAPADSLSGARDTAEIVGRLRAQAPRMRVLVMSDADGADGKASIRKPSPGELADPRAGERRLALGQELRDALPIGFEDPKDSASTQGFQEGADSVDELRATSARIRDPEAQGAVLGEVLQFAARSLRRVALFVVRDARAVGLAQRGLCEAGGPDDEGFRAIKLPIPGSGWLSTVIETRTASRVRDPQATDLEFASLLGTTAPSEAFIAPIESGGEVAVIVYGDMLPSNEPLPNTGALEVVLHQAGLALDRATLERVLGEG